MRSYLLFIALLINGSIALAGGGPANVLVLYNGEDSLSLDVADHYAVARDIPANQLCPAFGFWPTDQVMTFEDYETNILGAFNDCMSTLPQPEEINILVIVRGLPYRVDLDDGFSTSLQAMLQVANTTRRGDTEMLAGQGHSTSEGIRYASVRNPMFLGDGDQDEFELSNPYMGHYSTAAQIVSQATQPRSFRREQASEWFTWDFTDNLYLVSRLDGFDHDDAKDLVDRGAAADGTFPTSPIICMEAADSARGARDPECHFTIQHLASAGIEAEWIAPFDGDLNGESLAGLMTGTTSLQDGLSAHEWAPGAFVCNLTSYGAVPQNFWCSEDGLTCPESEMQTSIARFVRSGATGVHGTTNEPLNNSFVGAGLFLLQTFGYGMVESAMFTQRYLYWQNILLGDPLATPWAERPIVTIDTTDNHPANRPFSFQATHPDGIAEMRLYVDGTRVSEHDGDTLIYTIDGTPGQAIELLVVAIAKNGQRERIGWPEPIQQPRPDVQGWTQLSLTLGANELGDTGTDPNGEDTGLQSVEKAGCGCSSTRSTGAWWSLLYLIALLRRRNPQAHTAPNTMSSPSP
jgi:uncharacterized protein (TIGR03790 family)